MMLRACCWTMLRMGHLCVAILVFAWALGLPVTAARAADKATAVVAARLGVHTDKTRFVLELTEKVPYQVRFLTDPYRVTISLPAVDWRLKEPGGRSKGGLIASYRFSHDPAGQSQLTLTLREPVALKMETFLPPQDGHKWRLVIDLGASSAVQFARTASKSAEETPAPSAVAEAPPPPEPKPADVSEAVPSPPVVAAAPEVVPPPPAEAVRPAPPPAEVALAPPPAEVAPPPPAKVATLAPPPATPKSKPAARASLKPRPIPKGALRTAPKMAAPQTATEQPPAPPPSETAVAVAPPAPRVLPERAPEGGKSRPVIIIDPGHGGVDPGAKAPDGTLEKDVVLKIAKVLADRLEASGRYVPVLTRADDTFLKLSERVDIARARDADLFISLHCDALTDSPSVNGLSVYTLSEKASDKEAEALAGKENRSDIIAGVDLSSESDDVTFILIDLAQRETRNQSLRFAQALKRDLIPSTPMVKNANRQAGFRVLKAPDVPSVLVELGYLSNAADFARMTSDAWIEAFALAVISTVDRRYQGTDTRRVERAAFP